MAIEVMGGAPARPRLSGVIIAATYYLMVTAALSIIAVMAIARRSKPVEAR